MASNTAACTMAMSRLWRLLTRSADTVLTAIVFQSVTTSALAICGTPRSAAVLAIRIECSWFMCTRLHSWPGILLSTDARNPGKLAHGERERQNTPQEAAVDRVNHAGGDVSALLQAWSQGDVEARDRVMEVVYQELRRRAAAYLRRERAGHTLQPTALVHEAYLRLVDQNAAAGQNRAQ